MVDQISPINSLFGTRKGGGSGKSSEEQKHTQKPHLTQQRQTLQEQDKTGHKTRTEPAASNKNPPKPSKTQNPTNQKTGPKNKEGTAPWLKLDKGTKEDGVPTRELI